jgi:integrase
LAKFFKVAYNSERVLFSTFLLTGLRELEVVHLFWTDVSFELQTVRVTAKPELGFYPKRWEEREVPIPVQLIDLLKAQPRRAGCNFVFPSPKGNREYHMLDRCKAVAERAGLDPAKFDLKTFRSTFASRTLRTGFDVRTVQHWMKTSRRRCETFCCPWWPRRSLIGNGSCYEMASRLSCMMPTNMQQRFRRIHWTGSCRI